MNSATTTTTAKDGFLVYKPIAPKLDVKLDAKKPEAKLDMVLMSTTDAASTIASFKQDFKHQKDFKYHDSKLLGSLKKGPKLMRAASSSGSQRVSKQSTRVIYKSSKSSKVSLSPKLILPRLATEPSNEPNSENTNEEEGTSSSSLEDKASKKSNFVAIRPRVVVGSSSAVPTLASPTSPSSKQVRGF